MARSKRRWLLWTGLSFGIVLVGLAVTGYYLAQRMEPYLKEQTAAYLRRHFDSELEWKHFDVNMTMTSPLRVLLERGKSAVVRVRVDGIVLRHHGRTDMPPLLAMRRLSFEVELSDLWDQPAHIRNITLSGLDLNIPPAGQRPQLSQRNQTEGLLDIPRRNQTPAAPSVIIDRVDADGAQLRLLPKDAGKEPLEFDIHQLRLQSAGAGIPMQYTAILDNAKPPGRINSKGSFGPWNTGEPGNTPLAGDYTFRNADLGVFKGISGILSSNGSFTGQLDRLIADGETDTPDFRLATAGNPMPLHTHFHALVDGTNGNTRLDPVEATLGQTTFTARGAIEKNQNQPARTIGLDVTLDGGRLKDLLLLAMKGNKPILQGDVNLQMRMDLLPQQGDLADRLRLDGSFELLAAQFTDPEVQEKIDSLSRRGQGKPGQLDIAKVPSAFVGMFHLKDRRFDLKQLQFGVPGSLVQLSGSYLFGTEALDFRGQLRLQARLSKTMTGWKRIVLTPVDPFFAKDGYGTVLRIKVTGTRANPQFGLDR